ncbi:hypothetical protein ACIB24_17440 [Spongisporangium articulatum]|uniref:LemA family protein n=1 Tax=Spongisporangium articulatum TaxID=3362603 RepID=A0ABW8AR46_9ACTN
MNHPLTWGLLALAVALAVGWYLSYLAGRLDRLHHRVEASWAALDAQLARRAAVAREVAHRLPAERGPPLLAAAAAATDPVDAGEPLRGRDSLSEQVESALTRCLQATFADPDTVHAWRLDPQIDGLLVDLASAARRAQLARRFHNDAVAHAQRMRRKRVVRWARLAGRAAWPRMVELDDEVPAALAVETGQ